MAYGLAAIIAPAAGTFIFAGYGGGAVFAGCAGVGVAMGIGQLRLAAAIHQRATGSPSAAAGQRSPIPQAAGG